MRVFLFLLIFTLVGLGSVFGQPEPLGFGVVDGFYEVHPDVPTEFYIGSTIWRLAYRTDITIGEFLKGGSGGMESARNREVLPNIRAQIRDAADSQLPNEPDTIRVHWIQGRFDRTRWDLAKYSDLLGYAYDRQIAAPPRAIVAAAIYREEGKNYGFITPPDSASDTRSVAIFQATYVRVLPANGTLALIADSGAVDVSIQLMKNGSPSGRPIHRMVTGYAAIELPPGLYQMEATAPDRKSQFASLDVTSWDLSSHVFNLERIEPRVVPTNNVFDGTRIALGAGGMGFATREDTPVGVPALSLSLEARWWSLGFTAGGWGVKYAPTAYDSTGKRALVMKSLSLTLYPFEWLGLSGGFAWSDEVVLQTTKATKSWSGPTAGISLRWREIGGSPFSLIGRANAAYLLHTETGHTGSAWRPGVTAWAGLTIDL